MAASRRVRRRRRRVALVTGVVAAVIIVVVLIIGSGATPPSAGRSGHRRSAPPEGGALTADRLRPTWRGDGRAVTITVGGDVHFEGTLSQSLAADPQTALGRPVEALFDGAQLTMANLESALTNGTCPAPQPTPYLFWAPVSALTALRDGGISAVSQANNHAVDCGIPMFLTGLTESASARYPTVGVGTDDAAAYRPYRVTVRGQHIAIVAATQNFDTGLQATTSAGPHTPGVASALDRATLVAAVESARRQADTVVVFLTWGSDGQTCPDAQQVPLARALVRAGADAVVGSGAHVQQGAGYLGSALVDYGLGNLAFYDNEAPEDYSGTLVMTLTGRHVDAFSWRPAVITSGVPVAQTGPAAAAAVQRWDGLRGCSGLSATPGAGVATVRTESAPAHTVGRARAAGSSPTTTSTAPAN